MEFCCSSGIWCALCVYFWLTFIVLCGNWTARCKRWYGNSLPKCWERQKNGRFELPWRLSQYSRIWNNRKLLLSTTRCFWSTAQILAVCKEVSCGLLRVNTEVCVRGTQKLQGELSGAANKLVFLACPSHGPLQTHRALIWGCRDAYSSKSVIVCRGY